MRVCYYAHLRDDTGRDEETLSGPLSIRELLLFLANHYQEPLSSHVLTPDRTQNSDDIFILVNGRHLRQLDGMNTRLADSDCIALIPVTEAG